MTGVYLQDATSGTSIFSACPMGIQRIKQCRSIPKDQELLVHLVALQRWTSKGCQIASMCRTGKHTILSVAALRTWQPHHLTEGTVYGAQKARSLGCNKRLSESFGLSVSWSLALRNSRIVIDDARTVSRLSVSAKSPNWGSAQIQPPSGVGSLLEGC